MAPKYLAIAALLLIASAVQTNAADPDPLNDFLIPGNPTPAAGDFAFSGLKDLFRNQRPKNKEILVQAALSSTFPALNTQGQSLVLLKLGCNASVPSHVHPRATEVIFVLKGKLKVSFVDTTFKAFTNILYPGDVAVFPRGLLHGEINVGKGEAWFLAALNSANPGTQLMEPALGAIFS